MGNWLRRISSGNSIDPSSDGSGFIDGPTFGQQQQSAGSIFGGGTTRTSQHGGLFSSGQQQQQPSLFGQLQTPLQRPNLFGQLPQQQITVTPGNLFQPQQQQQVQGGLFQMPPQQQQQSVQQLSNVFGGAPSIFGGGGGARPAPFGAVVQPMVFQAQRNKRFCVDLRNPEPISFELSLDNYPTLVPATFQPHHQQQQGALNLTTNKTNQHNLDIIMETVKKDMQEWANSGIWPYSCYGPVGGKPCVPGFEDLSVDEYRYSYMLNGGSLPPQIPLQFQNTFELRQSYQQPSHENRLTIERIATTTTGVSSPQTQQTASIFGGGGTQQSQGALVAPVQRVVSKAFGNKSYCVDLRNPEPVSFEMSVDNDDVLDFLETQSEGNSNLELVSLCDVSIVGSEVDMLKPEGTVASHDDKVTE